MKWDIVKQTESEMGCEYPVECKHIKYAPIRRSDGETGFIPLKFILLQVVVQNERGVQLRLKLHNAGGSWVYVAQQPDYYAEQNLSLGGNRKVPDMLAEKVRVAGPKQTFESRREFVPFLDRVLGAELRDTVLDLFTDRLEDIPAEEY